MSEIKTANSKRHNKSKIWKNKYIVTKSTRSLDAIFRTKRFDVGFFWMEFYPLVKDMFMAKHKTMNNRDFEILIQLHSNQPFTKEDIKNSVLSRPNFLREEEHDKKTSLGTRGIKAFIDFGINNDWFYKAKNNGRYNKALFFMSPKMETDLRRLYSYMLCTSKIRINDDDVVHKNIRKSISHYKKMLKQNLYYDTFLNDTETEIKTTNSEFGIKLRDARSSLET